MAFIEMRGFRLQISATSGDCVSREKMGRKTRDGGVTRGSFFIQDLWI